MQSGTIRSVRPITTADDVAGAGAGELHWMILEKRFAKRRDGNFGRGFAGTVRVVSAQAIFFAVAMNPFAVLVTFVRCDEDGGARFVQGAQSFHNVDCAHDIRGISLDWLVIGETDNRLRSEVQNKIRLGGGD
jgi:hypothetical protein